MDSGTEMVLGARCRCNRSAGSPVDDGNRGSRGILRRLFEKQGIGPANRVFDSHADTAPRATESHGGAVAGQLGDGL